MTTVLRPGTNYPLGATLGDGGTNVATHSSVAERVELCLFDDSGVESRFDLHDDADVWHGFVPGMTVGQAYGFRVHGPFDPRSGVRCNPAKLLLDPYAKATVGSVAFGPEVLGHAVSDPSRPSDLDSAAFVPRSLVVDPTFEWGTAARPRRPLEETVFYELHVKGYTELDPEVPAELRGTYAGLAHPATIARLVALGVTTVELLPVHQSVPEAVLRTRGLTNYWGYNTIGFFAPHDGYSAAVRAGNPGGQVAEFQAMVRALHEAGLEVVLDVVYNHTAEAGPDGPTLCFRGLDNAAYYRLDPENRARYVDTTGCGNALDAGSPVFLRLLMDSLRYWVGVMGVDGFRFDLAATLARQDGSFDDASAFFDLVGQDPLLAQAHLVAEPWDVGQGDSYDVGRFPARWSEWNGRFRGTVRDFWRSHDGMLGDLAARLTGSADLYAGSDRGPTASVNLVTVHDGFTVRDLVSYDRKHNEANGEDNRDGTDDNRSWNCGVEGPSTDPDVLELRARQSRAMLATLLLAAGVPLLLGGDELGRSQQGNNNAYCQDNAIAWLDRSTGDADLAAFVARLIAFRQQHPVLRRREFARRVDALTWYTPAGAGMTGDDWADVSAKAIALCLDGTVEPEEAGDGSQLTDTDVGLLINGWWEPVTFALPWATGIWQVEIDTYDPGAAPRAVDGDVVVGPRSVAVLTSTSPRADR